MEPTCCPLCGSRRVEPYRLMSLLNGRYDATDRFRCKACNNAFTLKEKQTVKAKGICPFCGSKKINEIESKRGPYDEEIDVIKQCAKCNAQYQVYGIEQPMTCYKCNKVLMNLTDCIRITTGPLGWRHRKCRTRKKNIQTEGEE